MYDTVLVAVDGTEESLTAAEQAIGLTASGGTLHALSVVEKLPMHTRSGKAEKFESDDSELRSAAESALADVVEAARAADLECVTALEEGVPRRVIVSYADAIDPDAIVLGKRDASTTADDLLGSTAERVIRNAAVPVLTVPRN